MDLKQLHEHHAKQAEYALKARDRCDPEHPHWKYWNRSLNLHNEAVELLGDVIDDYYHGAVP